MPILKSLLTPKKTLFFSNFLQNCNQRTQNNVITEVIMRTIFNSTNSQNKIKEEEGSFISAHPVYQL
jgi:hypothetical protein